ncbi:MAG: hypothetical protein JWM04_750, partial [Verrucomicrobiales bacterium]|nr:hypothetical protein [Verrucomicrobiales bacterium]
SPDLPSKIHNRAITSLSVKDRKTIHLDEREGDGVAWWPDKTLSNGTIEFDVRGTNVMQKSFVGIAFHGLDEKTYDAVYLRPFNFQTTDSVRLSHGVQYISHPMHTWNKLRDEKAGQFEHEVSPAPDPNDWVHVKVLVEYPRVCVFINQSIKPSLDVRQLSDRKGGWIGLWVGNGSGGDFANLVIKPIP